MEQSAKIRAWRRLRRIVLVAAASAGAAATIATAGSGARASVGGLLLVGAATALGGVVAYLAALNASPKPGLSWRRPAQPPTTRGSVLVLVAGPILGAAAGVILLLLGPILGAPPGAFIALVPVVVLVFVELIDGIAGRA